MFGLYHETKLSMCVSVCVVMVLESPQWECPGSHVQHHRAPAAEEARSKVWEMVIVEVRRFLEKERREKLSSVLLHFA